MDKKFKGTYFISSISFSTMLTEYGISSIFALFMIYVLHFSTPLAANTYSYYYGFAYILPILIGYITDKYLTRSKAITLGFISMILSQLVLAFSSSLYQPGSVTYDSYLFNLQNMTFAVGLFFLALGTSFANLSVTSIINAINDDESVTHAFSIYYPIINMGVMLGSLITTIIIGNENYHLYQWSFLFFAIVEIIGLAAFHLLKKKYLVDNTGKALKDEPHKNVIRKQRNMFLNQISSESISKINLMNLKERLSLFSHSIIHKKELLFVFAIFLIINIFYRISYSQTSISMVFFIDTYVVRNFYFYEIPVQLFFILNPLYIILLSPLFIKLNQKLDEKNIKFGFANRIIVAMLFITICFVLLSIIGYHLDMNALPMNKIHFIWIMLFEVLLAISELFFSISSYSIIGDLAPQKYYSLFFGIFTATRAVSMYLSGRISALFPEGVATSYINNLPIDGLMSYFLIFVVITSIAILILIASRKKLDRILEAKKFTD